ncbi:hypothetical protein [Kutzneria sp. 744]|uniref:hypothetical protein n=1 Tax=Kutzneria sp. (strain 744) TaxID=345341 RepID=UPI0012FBB7A6|nr:hypothetical protein [Kutzneria sp. 744]
MQDLSDMRDTIASEGPQDPRPVTDKVNLTAAVIDRTISINVFLYRDDYADLDPKRAAAIRNKVATIAKRYNWKHRTNHADVRFVLRCSVKVIDTSLHHLVAGALIG